MTVIASLALFTGCGTDLSQSPIAPQALTLDQQGAIPASQFEPVSFRQDASPSQVRAARRVKGKKKYDEPKPREVSELIHADQGGQLLLDWEIKNSKGVTGSKVKAEVKVFSGALDNDTEVSIGLTNPTYRIANVELEFGAHGTQFHIPAEVSLDMEGLDLSNFDPSTLNFYWYDPDTDAYDPVPGDDDHFEYDLEQGKIKGIWYFPHFSRYSLGGGR